jgi:hypothetical protein
MFTGKTNASLVHCVCASVSLWWIGPPKRILGGLRRPMSTAILLQSLIVYVCFVRYAKVMFSVCHCYVSLWHMPACMVFWPSWPSPPPAKMKVGTLFFVDGNTHRADFSFHSHWCDVILIKMVLVCRWGLQHNVGSGPLWELDVAPLTVLVEKGGDAWLNNSALALPGVQQEPTTSLPSPRLQVLSVRC